ncbi:hypothetical protein RD792_015823 [Penstemon davidsonii]|uniref:2-oxoglutarate dehydrogenase, mitochondrial n=1 Tax=Penstemon davidsonii TaxID=160366 RepID=A0ABR0CKB7_9LAMI|nr:hypothetical protein RD792_015823 [Penstemon davidsonii]
MAWFRAGSNAARLAIRRTLSQSGSYVVRTRVVPAHNRYFHSTVFKPKEQSAPVPRPVPLSRLTDSFLDGTSSVYLEELQRAWEQDPSSVDESWDNFFRNFVGQASTSPGISGQTIQESMRLLLLLRAYQVYGHMKAKLDPLGLEERPIPDDLDLGLYGFTEADLDREFFIGVWRMHGFLSENRPVQTLRAILTRLEQAYCGSIGYEYMHIADREKCNWLRDKIETPTPTQYNRQRREVILDRLIWSTQFENFLAAKWTAAKRFGLEGCETLIPGMKEMFDRSADLGVESIVIGMSHRGRLNVLGNVVRKPLRQIFSEFSGGTKPVDEVGLYTGTGDVKYHLGTSYDRPTRGGKRIHLSLVANPSHLEAVDPVVVGKTRAKQYYSNDVDRTKNMGILIHGDGSFAGQGVVYETLHLSALPNYTTGGTIHIVVNNQVAFTTDPTSGRSSQYCTDVAKALSAPIFHVNGDDVEAVIRNHPSALEIYQKKLLESGQVSKDDINQINSKVLSILNEEFLASKDYVPQRRDWLSAYWTGFKSPEQLSRIRNTGVKPEILKNVGKAITSLPETFKPHRAVKRIFEDRAKMIETGEGIDWAVGEALAFATLLVEGNHVRLSGQDVERGTFSHRHSVIHDQETGEKYCPLDHVMINQNEEMFTPYIVYMGSSSNGKESDHELSHLKLLSSLIPSEESERIFLLNSYNHAFKGFSAILSEHEASTLSGYDEVVSVFPDPILKLHTTRSWDFLEAADSKFRSKLPHVQNPADVIIGIIDTGIWPESPSFSDRGIGKIPSKWKGVCMGGSNFNKYNCNRKLIGARSYSNREFSTERNKTSPTESRGSPRDFVGHGTHTASIAGGVHTKASYYGLAQGIARGGLLLLESQATRHSDFLSDPIAIGAFHAEQKGVAVVCSGGNDGPDPYTIVNYAPWIFTIAASSIDRDFQSTIVLGNNESYKVAASFTSASDARNCIPGSLDTKKVAGKIVVCVNDEPTVSRKIKKLVVEDSRAKGVIIIDGEGESSYDSPFDSGTYPFSEVEATIGSKILQYINSTKYPTATILPSAEIIKSKPAPVVASFSSRGPGDLTENILKPDIMAPGVAILAAIVPNQIESYYGAPGNKSSLFGIKSGTSMACPHVTGAMAFIKSVHPEWSFSMIKSALMTTSSVSNNNGKPLTNSSNHSANPHEIGVGEIRPIRALDPGLVCETTINDHLYFLCYYGYKQKQIRTMSNTNFMCPKNSTKQLISNINYPTISIGRLNKHDGPIMVKRVVTNVGSKRDATYVSTVNAPHGLLVKVVPKKIVFSQNMKRASFRVFFDGKGAVKGYNFGDIRWFDGSHIVRLVFAVNIE